MIKVNNDLSLKYTKGTIWIHWLSALLIIVLFFLGKYVEELEQIDKLGPLKLHAILGFLVLFLSIFRTYFFFKSPRPPHLDTGTKINNKIITWIHNIFYFLLFIISISGIATMLTTGYGEFLATGDVGLIKPHDDSLPLKVHEIMATIMMILLALHVFGVVKHKFLTGENALKRML